MSLAPGRSSASKVESFDRSEYSKTSGTACGAIFCALFLNDSGEAKMQCDSGTAPRDGRCWVGQRVQWNLQQTKLLLNALRLQIACNEQSSRWVDHDVPEGEWVKTEPKVGGCESQRSGFGCRGGGSDL